MLSFNELHVDLVRLLSATERLVAAGDASADGKWKNWSRFCQFISSLESLQSQLQVRLPETNASTYGSQQSFANSRLSAEDLDQYGRRLENLRRKREDLSSAAAAAAAAAKAAASSEAAAAAAATVSVPSAGAVSTTPEAGVVPVVTAAERGKNAPGEKFDQRGGGGSVVHGGRSRKPSEVGDPGRRVLFDLRSSEGGTGGGGGGRGGGGERGKGVDGAEADQVADEISSMARRLKESSIAINQTLRAQTQVLEDTGEAATVNVDKVKRETARVTERLRKRRAAVCVSWCMIIMVIVTFLVTYVLVILPFDKRRGPFVRRSRSTATVRQSRDASASVQRQKHVKQQQQIHQLHREMSGQDAADLEEVVRDSQPGGSRVDGTRSKDDPVHDILEEDKPSAGQQSVPASPKASREKREATQKQIEGSAKEDPKANGIDQATPLSEESAGPNEGSDRADPGEAEAALLAIHPEIEIAEEREHEGAEDGAAREGHEQDLEEDAAPLSEESARPNEEFGPNEGSDRADPGEAEAALLAIHPEIEIAEERGHDGAEDGAAREGHEQDVEEEAAAEESTVLDEKRTQLTDEKEVEEEEAFERPEAEEARTSHQPANAVPRPPLAADGDSEGYHRQHGERVAVAEQVRGEKEAVTPEASEGPDITRQPAVRFDGGAAYGVILGTTTEKSTESRAQRDDGEGKSAAAVTGAADSASAVADAPCEETSQTALTAEEGGDASADGGADEDGSLEAVRRRLRESMGNKRGAQDEL